MKRIVYNFELPRMLSNQPIPKPRVTEVLVKIASAGVNPVDAKFVFGDKLPDWPVFKSFARWWVHNCTPGFDFAGVVEETGPGASAFKAGDRVFGTAPPFVGTFAEYVAVPVDQVCLMPANVSFDAAAALPLVGLTCLQSMERHGVCGSGGGGRGSGGHILVLGASGGAGHIAVQMAKAFGARVVGVCSSSSGDFVTSLGADATVDYQQSNWLSQLQKQAASHGPFTFVFDAVTSADSRDSGCGYQAAICAAAGLLEGPYVRLGGPVSAWLAAGVKRTAGVDLFPAHTELFWVRFPHSSEELQRVARMAERGHLRPSIAQLHPFTAEGVAEAFAQLRQRHTRGKHVLKIAELA